MTTFLSICDLTKEVSTSFGELPNFRWLLLNSVQKVKKFLPKLVKATEDSLDMDGPLQRLQGLHQKLVQKLRPLEEVSRRSPRYKKNPIA